MNLHMKTATILLGTLVIGMVCGALIRGVFARDRMQPPPQMTRERFVERWVKMMRLDQEQIRKVREVVGAHEPRFRENYMRHRMEMEALVDSLHHDLKPLLTEKQRERVIKNRRRLERRRELRREKSQESRRGRKNKSGERGINQNYSTFYAPKSLIGIWEMRRRLVLDTVASLLFDQEDRRGKYFQN